MHYFGKVNDGAVNYADALAIWEQVAHQKDNMGVAARAKYWLGTLYYEGRGVHKNNRLALRYLNEAAQQNRDSWARMEANAWLAWLYYEGGGVVRKDYKQAIAHWDCVAHQQDNVNACVDALLSIGEVYTIGGYGISKDEDRARSYFERVLEEETNSEYVMKAKEWLESLGHKKT